MDGLPVHDDSSWKVSIDLCILSQCLGYGRTHVVVQLLCRVGVKVGHAEILGEGTVHAGHNSTDRPSLLSTVMVRVVANDHGVFEGDFNSPRLSTKLRIHLDGDFGGNRHQPLRLAEHSTGDALARDGLLQTTLFLDSSVVITLSRSMGVNLQHCNK